MVPFQSTSNKLMQLLLLLKSNQELKARETGQVFHDVL
jgi:hypothetical protein